MSVAGRRTRRIDLLVAVGIAACIAGALSSANIYAAVGALSLLIIVLLITAPMTAVSAVIAGSALDRFGLQVGGANVHLDLLVVLVLAGVVVNRIAVRTLPPTALWSPLVLPLAAYVGLNVLSTVLFAVEKSRGLKLDVEVFVAALTYVVVFASLRRRRDIQIAMTTLWIVSVSEALIGLLFAAAYFAHLTDYGVAQVAVGVPAAFGTLWEPNVFGSFLVGNFFLLLADHLGHDRRGRYTVGLLIVFFGIGASLTRTVWITVLLGVLAFYLRSRLSRPLGRRAAPALVSVCILALVALFLSLATPVGGRLLDIVNLQSTSAAGRLQWFHIALAEWSMNPLFGLGTGSWNVGAVPGQPHPWLPSLFLLTLHDTGLLGLASLAGVIWAFFAMTVPAARDSSEMAFVSFGAIVAFSCLLVAFQTTTGFWFSYIWIVMAVGTAASRLSLEEPCE